MADPATLISTAVGGVGLLMKADATSKNQDAYKQENAAQIQAEQLREQQMELESAQKQREIMRQASSARAAALTGIAGQTGGTGGSATPGALGAITANTAVNSNFVANSLKIGQGIFDANVQYANASLQVQQNNAESSFGSDLFSAAPSIGRIGSTLFNGKQTTNNA